MLVMLSIVVVNVVALGNVDFFFLSVRDISLIKLVVAMTWNGVENVSKTPNLESESSV